ncbi:very long chain fatty acid elongase AAEL008004-like isoform X1 [Haematobia irritans]|uniref:very long chain fatty acid elongase AAEL008004-like isoform X1 n=1 Tax=Haematobia irritans TaxID=7368 RepID=UPI003F5000F9
MSSALLKHYYDAFTLDTRTEDAFLMSRPGTVFGILAVYLLIVRKIGPAFMANRKPYNIQPLMQFYNIMQVLMNAYMFWGGVKTYYLSSRYNLSCVPIDRNDRSPETMGLFHFSHLYFLNKIIDLLDTVFFVLRKKNNQITYLHVYHHVLMVITSYGYNRFIYGSHFSIVGIVNTLVHMLMYTYYFVAASKININIESWKRRMTKVQICQFGYIALSLAVPLMNNWCGLPYFWLVGGFLQNFHMTIMFVNFYKKTYLGKKLKI